jgi:uncharacterized protein YfaS (alpha-2-macroglobulin family)
MSRFYPTILAADALKKTGTKLESLRRPELRADGRGLANRFHLPAAVYDSAEMQRMAQAGLERLYKFQHSDWGWGWWETDKSTPYMTAYVLMGLRAAQDAGVQVRDEVYRLRAETPGTFKVLPAAGFAMYAPEIQAKSPDRTVRIVERDK